MAEPTMKERVNAAFDTLYEAQSDFQQASERHQRAQRDCTTALNELNKAQKVVDALFSEHKNTAHKESDWARGKSMPVTHPASELK